MTIRPVLGFAALTVAVITLSGCVANNTGTEALTVAITDDSCAVSAATATSGAITFSATNNGTAVNEFEILADDKLRIVGEKENITPGQTVDYVIQLEPGTYYTECKLGMVGAGIGTAEFTVTGTTGAVDADERERADAAVTNYVSYVKDQVGELVPAVDTFAEAYASGDDDTARSLFPTTRVHYERIEPTAEAFGDLDPQLDFREPMAEEDGIEFTGFHRIEKDLWAPDGFTPSSAAERRILADDLISDVGTLYDLVYSDDFTVTLSDISNGAIGLLDEVAASKITGEEDEFSHTDLWDFQANVEGASVAYGNVREIAEARGEDGSALVADIDEQFENLNFLLAQHGSLADGFTYYDELTPEQIKELSDGINALAEPLAVLTHTVLDIPEPTE
ncbi:iron uptake system component EfeO [Mycetocola sp. CAN_C7]|uniref:iron uptake system protein EfeO n=1 Tax=Mycetocola sp. CAN_C7 TaxID=2787724 RepID=UPI0018C973BF